MQIVDFHKVDNDNYVDITWYHLMSGIKINLRYSSNLYLSFSTCGVAVCRRFNLYGPYENCKFDWFYMFTVDSSKEICMKRGSWPIVGNVVKSYPMFFYSKTSDRASLASNNGEK